MTIEINKTNQEHIARMIRNNKSFTQIKNAMLALDMVETAEQAEEYLTEQANVQKGTRKGFTSGLYEFLSESPRTQVEMYSYIKENGSASAWKNRKLHEGVRKLTVRMHVNLSGAQFTESLYSEDESAAEDQEAA